MKVEVKKLETEKIREDFPVLRREVNGKQLVYLDNAATSQKPRQVLDAMNEFYSFYNANVHRGIHKLAEEATLAYEDAHRKAGEFINAQSMEEIIFTRNTTEALNLLAYSLTKPLRKGDEILLTQMEHHSNLVPWQQISKERGLVLKFIDIDENGELKKEDFSKITEKTKIVSVTHMSNVLGTINPVKEIAKIAHENGALMVVDGAQSVPHFPVDVQSLGCDFLAFSGHKMLGPTGIGVLYGRKSLLEGMSPFLYGGETIREVQFQFSSWNDLPWKFEAGSMNIAEGIGLSAAIDYLQKLGMENVFAHEQSLTEYAYTRLEEEDVQVYGPKPNGRGGVLAFNVDGVHAHDLSTLLDQEGIAIRGGHHCAMPLMGLLGVAGTARASLYLYNTKEEIDKLIAGIQKAKKVFA